MSLDAHLLVDRGTFALDVAFTAEPGQVLGVIGPNGAGKTTLLRALAGLTPLTGGRIELAGRRLDDVPVEDRKVGVVFQDYLLFPHLSALENVAYGLRVRGVRKAEARAAAHEWLDRFGLAGHAGKRPGGLSGGQAQRVALARALAVDPDLLLLDEPLSALDAGTRLRLRTDLRTHLTSYRGPSLVITHDPIEAMILADRLVVLEGGRIVQEGSATEVTRRPATDYVARLVGLNLYRGTAADGHATLDAGGAFTIADRTLTGPVHVAVRPSEIALYRSEPTAGSPRNTWRGRIVGVEAWGDRVRVAVDGEPPTLVDLTPDAVADLDLAAGHTVWLTAKASSITAYPA
ncbi:ABC transporter ATP-binding protein [Cryptosporangium arvum]|uniref:ABC-type spermidine/putrescine transport system, ATPase component n=1 Tax=Cryptosporangium arvum DSM 44712 TaxID=927661 RepID=A0A011ACD9_9ACTN|nr:ABC transporter ATP-binding protein [Cryptosporangium arvum]EXG79701.1 ABC-type spermidine/putrescine transport system, ATPase component [Cryptosporangium arvum DSM 44712]